MKCFLRLKARSIEIATVDRRERERDEKIRVISSIDVASMHGLRNCGSEWRGEGVSVTPDLSLY